MRLIDADELLKTIRSLPWDYSKPFAEISKSIFISTVEDAKTVTDGIKTSGKQTNADIIREMSNEQLAEVLFKSHCFMCEYYQQEIHTCGSPRGFICSPNHVRNVIEKWLESEAHK